MPDPLYIFAYGSLIWKPGFDWAERRLAALTGWRRSFCMSSIHYRGTPEAPGLVLALVGFFLICFLSLLFLLMKERRTTGFIQVRVRGAGGAMHVTNIPATSPWTMSDVSGRVYYARELATVA